MFLGGTRESEFIDEIAAANEEGVAIARRFLRWTAAVEGAAGNRAPAQHQAMSSIADGAARLKIGREQRGLVGLRAEIEALEAEQPKIVADIDRVRVEDIRREVREHEEKAAAEAAAAAARLDPLGALRELEGRFELRVRVNKDGELEAAPAGRAQHLIVKAIVARHRLALVDIVKARDTWVEL